MDTSPEGIESPQRMGQVLQLAGIPVIAAIIGYVTNWLAVKMMFAPMEWIGVGPVGWQGVIPSKAGKMASISTDTGLMKVGDVGEFYRALDPRSFSDHIIAQAGDELHDLVERIMRRENPEVWASLPPEVREEVHRRVQAEFPEQVAQVMEDIGDNIDHLMDLKQMIVTHLERRPDLVNRIFSDVGEREFAFIVRSGAVFGFVLGLVQLTAWLLLGSWWILPAAGLAVGWLTNWVALRIIFSPVDPVWIGRRHKIQGLFLKRQDAVSDAYSDIVTGNILTVRNFAHELLHGPQSDRTRRLISDRLRPSVDEALGRAAPAVRLATGAAEYDAVQAAIAEEAVEPMMQPLADDQFNRERGATIDGMFAGRMRELPAREFAEMLRSAFREDEWQLIAVGAALGGIAGTFQLILVYGGG
jgi:uncharacterized membrane protein YheB (UPF0754 family)